MALSQANTILYNLSHLLAAFFTNSKQFHQEWTRYTTDISHRNDISGRWRGKWQSDVNRHSGELKCLISRIDSGHCRAIFHATYWRILRVCYSVNLSVELVDGRFKFRGETDLGRLAGGVYYYDGEATSSEYVSSYKCQYDHGSSHMSRLDCVSYNSAPTAGSANK